eukprot:5487887-Pyramimonas_sp.AAC.1
MTILIITEPTAAERLSHLEALELDRGVGSALHDNEAAAAGHSGEAAAAGDVGKPRLLVLGLLGLGLGVDEEELVLR